MKNILEPASLIALGCAVGLNLTNPMQYKSIEARSLKPNFSYMEYHVPFNVSSGAIVTQNSILANCEQYVEVTVAKKMYTTTKVNVRTDDSLDSEVVTILERGKSIEVFKKLDNGWTEVLYKNKVRYIYSKYLSKKKPSEEILGDYVEYAAPSGHHPKTYMDWDCITDISSAQYRLKQLSYVGNYGIIMHQDRYCVALGTGFIKGVGTKFDLVLENGTIIKCIAGDVKADAHTDGSNKITSHDGSVAEFIVNTSSLVNEARRMGDISYSCPEWNSEIVKIKVYQQRRK